jgi:DNA-directed RNA polymerase subunit E'/Rpb7
MRFIDKLLVKGQEDATSALRFALSGTKQSGEAIRKLRRNFTDEEFNALSGYMLGRMGMPNAGVATMAELGAEGVAKEGAEYMTEMGFSPKTFLRNWNTLSKEAKEALFKGTNYQDLVPELDNLAFVINRIGESASAMANPSGTSRVAYAMGMFAPLAAEVVPGVASEGFEYGLTALIAPYATAKLFTNKDMVKWFADGVQKSVYSPQSFGQHVRRLYQISEINPDIRDEVRAMLNGLTQESVEPISYQDSSSEQEKPAEVKNELSFRQSTPSSIADKVIPQAQNNKNIKTQLDQMLASFQPSNIPLVPPATAVRPQDMLSETILPNPKDRELAERLAMGSSGIGSLT